MNEQMQRDIEAVERVLMQAFRLDSDVDAWLRIKASMLADEQTKERPVIAPPSEAAATADERFRPAPAGVSEAGHIDLLRRALPFLSDAAKPYEDDGANEPLEIARDIEAALDEVIRD